MSEGRIGGLLVNLGTPASPRVADVRRYLREFLGDPRVIDLPAAARWLLLHFAILPFRPRRSAQAYAQVWTPEGSPLLVHSRTLRDALAKELGEGFAVELAMRYGEPSIRGVLARLAVAEVTRVVVLPLFPQYSSAVSGSVLTQVFEELARTPTIARVETVEAFYDDPGFISALAAVARPRLAAFAPDFVLLSFHGLPEHQVKKSDRSGRHCLASETCCEAIGAANRDCYRAQCFATGRALARTLDLAPDRHAVAFQSRLGRRPWIRPYSDRLLPELAARGVRRLAVICPSFVADCLETLEEVGIRMREQWRSLGGEDCSLVPCLNAEPLWVETVASWLRARAHES